MVSPRRPVDAHLVGSAPFKTAEEMFRFTMNSMVEHIQPLPDGEVGERDHWIR